MPGIGAWKLFRLMKKKNYFQLESSSNRQKEALISEQKPKQTEAVEKTIQKAILAVRRCIYTTSRKFHWENYKTCTHRRYRFHCENRKAKQNRRLARSGKLWKSRNSFAQALFIFNAMTISTPGGATAPSQLFPLIARSRLKISTSFCYDRSSFIIVELRVRGAQTKIHINSLHRGECGFLSPPRFQPHPLWTSIYLGHWVGLDGVWLTEFICGARNAYLLGATARS